MKLIVFGGAFDPPHRGHLEMVYACHDHFPEAKLLVLPTAQSPTPGKDSLTPIHMRMEMLDLHFKSCEKAGWLEISDLESKLSSPNFTLHTLQYLLNQESYLQEKSERSHHLDTKFPHSRPIAMIIGQDQWEKFHTWHLPSEILEICDLIIFSRDDDQSRRFNDQNCLGQTPTWISPNRYRLNKANLYFIDDKVCKAASREIRANIQSVPAEELSTNWVSGAVLEYIVKHGLYRG